MAPNLWPRTLPVHRVTRRPQEFEMNTAIPPTKRSLPRALLAAAALAWLLSAGAQPVPGSPIKVLLGVAPGSAPDVAARSLAEAMEPLLAQPLLLENRAGAGGTLAASAVAGAAADGHTLNVSGCSGDAITH